MAYDEEKYIKGFNEGYILAKHAPELSEKLTEIKGENPRLEGLLDGIEQYGLEMKREWQPSWEKDGVDFSPEREEEKDIEPEP